MMRAAPFSLLKQDPRFESSVVSLTYEPPLLSVLVSVSKNVSYAIDFSEQIWAFRYMEEGDLTYYWDSGEFENDFFLYQVLEGGWLSKEGSSLDILGIATSADWLKEWFIATRNYSVTVLSTSSPTVRLVGGA